MMRLVRKHFIAALRNLPYHSQGEIKVKRKLNKCKKMTQASTLQHIWDKLPTSARLQR